MNRNNIFLRIVNKILRHSMINSIPMLDKCLFLTFDDGPEPGITEFVLDELNRYGFKATFFCRGDNAEKYLQLLERLRKEGHSIANHTYSHIHSYNMGGRQYAEDVHCCDTILKTTLFRPPHGSLKLSAWLRLRKDYKIFFWSLNSGDSDMEHYDYERSISMLKAKTKPGDIVLFHFCHRHEKETRELLPIYLKWLFDNGYKSNALK